MFSAPHETRNREGYCLVHTYDNSAGWREILHVTPVPATSTRMLTIGVLLPMTKLFVIRSHRSSSARSFVDVICLLCAVGFVSTLRLFASLLESALFLSCCFFVLSPRVLLGDQRSAKVRVLRPGTRKIKGNKKYGTIRRCVARPADRYL